MMFSSNHHDWSTFFKTETATKQISRDIISETINIAENENYYIYYVLFNEMKNRSIYFSSENANNNAILVEDATFSFASYDSTEYGGNIFIKNSKHFIQNRICCSNCTLGNIGKHSCSYVEENENYIIQSSFSRLSGPGIGAFFNNYGDIQINQTNITKCQNYEASSFYIGSLNKNSTVVHSHFENNTATGRIGLGFEEFEFIYMYQIFHCNIIKQNIGITKNMSPYGVIFITGNAIFDSCVIKDNTHTYQYLISLIGYDGMICLVTNSYLENPGASKYQGFDPTITNEVKNIDMIKIEMLTSQICHDINFTFFQAKKQESFSPKYVSFQSLTLS